MNRTMKLTLVGSLILNVLLIGVLLGRLPRDVGFGRQERIERALQDLPEPTQTRFREKLQQMRAAGDPMRKQIVAERERALAIIGTDPFDEAAYDRQVGKINDLQLERLQKMGQVVKEIVKELPAEERLLFAGVLRRPPSSR